MQSPGLVYNVDVGKITNRYEYDSTTNKKSMLDSMNSSIQSFSDEYSTYLRIGKHILAHSLVIGYFSWASVYFFKHSKQILLKHFPSIFPKFLRFIKISRSLIFFRISRIEM